MKRVMLFLEDVAQEGMIKGLVARVAQSIGVSVRVESRNARGGKGKMKGEFRKFIKHIVRTGNRPDIIVVCQDTDCERWQDVQRGWLKGQRDCVEAGIKFVGAFPEPEIEYWYLFDQKAFNEATGAVLRGAPRAPSCGRGRSYRENYKGIIVQALNNKRIKGSGAEFGEDIAVAVDLTRRESLPAPLSYFITQVESALRDC